MSNQESSELSKLFMLGVEKMMDASFVYMRQNDLTLVQMNLLFFVYHQGPQEVTKLTEPLQTTKGAVSQLVDRMVNSGLISRTESTEDRRSKIIDLTEKGKDVVLGAIDFRGVWIEEKLSGLPLEQKTAIEEASAKISRLLKD